MKFKYILTASVCVMICVFGWIIAIELTTPKPELQHECLCEENRKLIQKTNRRLSLFLRDQAPPSDLEDYLLEDTK